MGGSSGWCNGQGCASCELYLVVRSFEFYSPMDIVTVELLRKLFFLRNDDIFNLSTHFNDGLRISRRRDVVSTRGLGLT